MKYKLVISEYESTVQKETQNYLDEGWELFGPPQLSISKDDYSTKVKILQAVVLYEPGDNEFRM